MTAAEERVQGAGPVPDRGRWLCCPAQGPLLCRSSGGVWDVLQEQPGEGPQRVQQEAQGTCGAAGAEKHA